MKRKVFLKKYVGKFLLSLLLVGIIVYTLMHVFGSSSGSLMTMPARLRTDWRLIGGEAYLFREELVLEAAGSGVVQTLAESGTKVAKNEAIAEVWHGYDQEEIEAVQIRLDRLNRLISVVEKSIPTPGTTLAEAERYRAEATQLHLAIRQAMEQGKWGELTGLEDSLLVLINRYESLIGKNEELSSYLEALREERTNLLRGSCTEVQNSQASGYFYDRSHVDGYEGIFTPQALSGLTVAGLESLIASEPEERTGMAVGKMVYGHTWHLALVMAAKDAALLEEGTPYEATFPENGQCTLQLTCSALQLSEGGSVLVIFACDEVPSDFAYLRSQRIELTVGHTTGYYVPESALYTVDGIDGVYIFEESTICFRRVEILYRGDGYCIVAERGDRGADYLDLNDLIVTSGQNLYDGRVYQ